MLVCLCVLPSFAQLQTDRLNTRGITVRNPSGTIVTTLDQSGSNTFLNINQTVYLNTTSGVDYGTQINTLQTQLPATGGAIGIPCTGQLSFSTPIVINTSITLFGTATGAASNATSTATEPCTLKWAGTGSSDAITITIPAGNNLHGVTFKNFTLIGNKASQAAGNGIILKGGNTSTQLDHITLDHVDVRDFKTDNIAITDNTFIVDLFDCFSWGAAQDSLHVYQTGLAGIPSQLRIHGGWYGGAVRDGIRIDSGYSGSGEIFGVTASNNTNDGVTVSAGAFKIIGGDFESNTQIAIFLGSTGSVVIGPNTFGNAHAGVWIANGGNQNLVLNPVHDSGTIDDIHIVAGAADNIIDNPLSTLAVFDAGTRTSWRTTNPNISAFSETISGPIRFVEDPASSLGFLTGYDYLYGDLTSHCLRASYNATSLIAGCIPVEGRANTFSGSNTFSTSQTIQGAWYFAEVGAAGGVGAATPEWADSGDHFLKYNPNNTGEQHVPQVIMLTSQYTNSTTGFTNVAGGNTIQWSVNANQKYTATCHLYYQAASTGGLNIEFTGPSSPNFVSYGLNLPVSATAQAGNGVATAYSTSLGSAVTTATTNFDAVVSFSLSNGANAGTVNLLAKSSAAVQLQIQTGSFCQIQ